MDLNALAIILSVVALASSTYLAFYQTVLMRRANYLPVYVDLLTAFRSSEFHEQYRFVTEILPVEHDAQLGFSGLPDDAKKAAYNIAYYYQNFAVLRLIGIIDEEVIALLHLRIVKVWQSLEPFVRREREIMGTTGIPFMRVLEDFAADAEEFAIGSVVTLLQRRHKVRRRYRKRMNRRAERFLAQVDQSSRRAQEPQAPG
ncbi:hypothetical protein [Streptomyces sp. NPDC019890]|uniref:DUF4760 domain-containing protein n=1 Tax=Streptomyces sp. NPDC019890 TaxID=3365064 RepID=UPI00384B6310